MKPFDLRPHLHALVHEVARALPYLVSDQILFVAGAARRRARATVRPLYFEGGRQTNDRWTKPQLYYQGVRQRYEITLRPAFFLLESGERRLQIILHELWHIDPSFDGSLSPERRHENLAPGREKPFIDELRSQLNLPSDIQEALNFQGTVMLCAWLHRPATRYELGTDEILRFDDDDLFDAVIHQRGTASSESDSSIG